MFDLHGRLDKTNTDYIELKRVIEDHMLNRPNFETNLNERLLERSIYTFLERTNLSALSPVHYNVVLRLVEYYWNTYGAVGVTSERMGDVTIDYTDDIPKDILRSILRYRVLP